MRARFAGGRISEESSSAATPSSVAGDKRLSSAIEDLRTFFRPTPAQSVDAFDSLRNDCASCCTSGGDEREGEYVEEFEPVPACLEEDVRGLR